MTEQSFSADEIRTFLAAVDRHLETSVRVVILGGGAAALAHQIASSTVDIDTYTDTTAELDAAIAAAAVQTGLNIPMRRSAVAEAPYNFEDRLERQLPELEHLQVWTLEKHDLVISKALRCEEHDLMQIVEMHTAVGLDFDVLVERYVSETDHMFGDGIRRRSLFLRMILTVFGELKWVFAQKRIPRKQ